MRIFYFSLKWCHKRVIYDNHSYPLVNLNITLDFQYCTSTWCWCHFRLFCFKTSLLDVWTFDKLVSFLYKHQFNVIMYYVNIFPFLYYGQDFYRNWLWVPRRMACKKQELLTLPDSLILLFQYPCSCCNVCVIIRKKNDVFLIKCSFYEWHIIITQRIK